VERFQDHNKFQAGTHATLYCFISFVRFGASVTRLRIRTRVIRGGIAILLAAASSLVPAATSQSPAVDVVILDEQIVSFTPVSGSILQGMMLGEDKIASGTGYVLLPAHEARASLVCIRVATRDGAYIGNGQLTPASNTHGLHAFRLSGEHFAHLTKGRASASLLAWLATDRGCEVFEAATLLPTAWSRGAAPWTLRLLINSSGFAARLAYKASNDAPFRQTRCEAMAVTGVARVYDTVCEAPLCDLARADRVLVEVLNRGQRVHLERLMTPQLSRYCASTS
jgi:hypothetical protein